MHPQGGAHCPEAGGAAAGPGGGEESLPGVQPQAAPTEAADAGRKRRPEQQKRSGGADTRQRRAGARYHRS